MIRAKSNGWFVLGGNWRRNARMALEDGVACDRMNVAQSLDRRVLGGPTSQAQFAAGSLQLPKLRATEPASVAERLDRSWLTVVRILGENGCDFS